MRWAAVLAWVLMACGDVGDDPVVQGRGLRVVVGGPRTCREALNLPYDEVQEAAAFFPSLEVCATLAEWTSVVRGHGVELYGLERRFVRTVCEAGDAWMLSLPICREARANP